MTEVVLAPVPPYSLAQSARWSDPTRRRLGAMLEVVFEVDGRPSRARVVQRADGRLVARIDGNDANAAIDHLRFLLAVDDDHRPFLEMARDDPLLRDVVDHRRGLRPMRTATVAHALVKAVCGQLIAAQEARRIERRILARIGRTHAGLHLAPTCGDLRGLSPAALIPLGLAPRRAAALGRVVRTLDLERLRAVETARAVARIQRERTLGPWSAGVVALYGLGRYEHGPVGDLGLVRLCGNLLGRTATADDTARLLARYGDWAGLAGVHLLGHPLARRRHADAA